MRAQGGIKASIPYRPLVSQSRNNLREQRYFSPANRVANNVEIKNMSQCALLQYIHDSQS